MVFGTSKQIKEITDQNTVIAISGDQVERVSEARNLGVLMDESLQFEWHVADVIKTCFYRFKTLYYYSRYS